MILSIISTFLPSFLSVPLYKLRGYKIGKNSKIRFGSFIISKKIELGDNASIGPFAFIKSKALVIGDYSSIRPLVFIKANNVSLAQYVQIGGPTVISGDDTPNSRLEIGDHSRILPLCWMDPGEGIFIGKQTGVGGGNMFFTHGYWTSYLKRGPHSLGPIIIGDYVHIGWRSFFMPNVTVENNTIIGANTVVTKSIEENSLFCGIPGKLIKKLDRSPLTLEELNSKMSEILISTLEFAEYKQFNTKLIDSQTIQLNEITISTNKDSIKTNNDILLLFSTLYNNKEELLNNTQNNIIDLDDYIAFIRHGNKEFLFIITHLRKFGIRLYLK